MMNDDMNLIKLLQTILNMYYKGCSKEDIFKIVVENIIEFTHSSFGFICYSDYLIDVITNNNHKNGNQNGNQNDLQNDLQNEIQKIININDCVIVNQNLSSCIKNYFVIPIKCNNMGPDRAKTKCVIGVCNRMLNNKFAEYDGMCDIIQPLTDVCCMILHSFQLSTLIGIYEKIVHNSTMPMLVYQSNKSFIVNNLKRKISGNDVSINENEMQNMKAQLGEFRCLIVNKKFCEKTMSNEMQIQNQLFSETFPGIIASHTIFNTITRMFQHKENQYIESIMFEDILLHCSQYQFRFCYVDENTFIMSIDDISYETLAKETADQILLSKEEFIANISHEMRTPLNGIIGYISLMLDTRMDDYQRECFGIIRKCSMNLLYRVNDLLDLTKLTAGKMELNNEDFYLLNCIRMSNEVNLIDAKNKNIELTYFVDPEVPLIIFSDQHKLEQILMNLLNNAIKFTQRGKINTHVRLIDDPVTRERLDIRNRYTIEFSVSDTGVGIKENDIPKLFHSFTQINNSNSGTGLGLVISKKLCELMGGDIRAESIYGKGSKFTFKIKAPGKDLVPNNIIPYDKKACKEPLMDITCKDKRILVIHEDENVRIKICTWLSEIGIFPMPSTNNESALQYIEKRIIDFDLIFIDITTFTDTFLKQVHKINNHVPVVILDNHTNYHKEHSKNSNKNLNDNPNENLNENPNELLHISISEYSVKHLCFQLLAKNHLFSSSVKIILAEDNLINQKVTVELLKNIGYKNIDVVENGILLVESVRQHDYDIILLDIKMPLMNGCEAAKEINKIYKTSLHKNRKKPKIVALTGRVMAGTQEKCIEHGMDGYLTKPIDIHILEQTLAKIISKN